ncbi:group II intron maturase-specific domain-containing protein [Marinobacter sp. Arc7-DN-1]|uniref:group II intron maturase-specific domain-containing protein n=1 Tax=Marinobacter sp. Arc7-DN-1 TaxID=2304594 RepID=UPI001D0D9CB9|nr:group II intron maturase-specific domain-containing protein [Marinobacter sp. Arc7-DN-1]
MKLTVNEDKSAVGRPWERVFLGFTFTRQGRDKRRKVSDDAITQFKNRVRKITRRTRGRTMQTVIDELAVYLRGWKGYYGFAQVKSPIQDLEKWVRRKLRCYHLKQWGRSGYRQLRKRGVSVRLAWNTAKSAHGPWRLSRSPGLAQALPRQYFLSLGLPDLVER